MEMFKELKIVNHYIGNGNACEVSIREETPQGLRHIIPPSELVGTGGCYGAALEDYLTQLDAYRWDLKMFSEQVLDTKRAYTEAVEIECVRERKIEAGAEVWVLERDEEDRACEVTGYMFLAEVAGFVIVSGYINGMEHIGGILAYHAQETAENYDTDLAVFPAVDCFTTREAAHAALDDEQEAENDVSGN